MFAELKRTLVHDYALEEYRSPLGARKTGETITLRLRALHSGVLGVQLVLFGEQYEQRVPMQMVDGAYTVQITLPERPIVLWYYFLINTAQRQYYYGAGADHSLSTGMVYTEPPAAFQLTVYEKYFATPDWFKKSVMYQIFPDRFARGDTQTIEQGLAYHRAMGREVKLHESWDEPVDYLPENGHPYYTPNDFYGGTLMAIEERLPYFKQLGVDVLYLNPVFEADSNHRYNTSDYLKIDPILGTNEDFRRLADAAQQMGIRIMLDGVFSHTGADSIYFNRKGNYPQPGAYQGPSSPYYDWYDFFEFPNKYRAWWGFDTLPEVKEEMPSWQNFIIKSNDSVIKSWIAQGASGYRLDVADELPDYILSEIRTAVKATDQQAVVLGEVWEDATTKVSYGQHRNYALGWALDSVMNYPLRNAIVDFVKGKINAFELAVFLCKQRLNYPLPMYYALMNLLSSHDIERIRTALSVRFHYHELSREQQASFRITDVQDEQGAKLQKLCVALQFVLPGVPSVYYGDETGMQGFFDPFNRAPFVHGNCDLTQYYAQLSQIRHEEDALTTGEVVPFATNDDMICILRVIQNQADVFGNPAKDGVVLCAVNRSAQQQYAVVDLYKKNRIITDEMRRSLKGTIFTQAVCALTGQKASVNDGLIGFEIAPQAVCLFVLS